MKYKYFHGHDLPHVITSDQGHGKIAKCVNEEDALFLLGFKKYKQLIIVSLMRSHKKTVRKIRNIRNKLLGLEYRKKGLPEVLQNGTNEELEMALADYCIVLEKYSSMLEVLLKCN